MPIAQDLNTWNIPNLTDFLQVLRLQVSISEFRLINPFGLGVLKRVTYKGEEMIQLHFPRRMYGIQKVQLTLKAEMYFVPT